AGGDGLDLGEKCRRRAPMAPLRKRLNTSFLAGVGKFRMTSRKTRNSALHISPFRVLQSAQQATRLLNSSVPPRLIGTSWSVEKVRASIGAEQYGQRITVRPTRILAHWRNSSTLKGSSLPGVRTMPARLPDFHRRSRKRFFIDW